MRATFFLLAVTVLVLPAPSPPAQSPSKAFSRGSNSGSGGPQAATAAVSLHGTPCGAPCASLNAGGGRVRGLTLPNEYCYGHRFTTATTIVGFQLFTRTASAGRYTMTCALYRSSGIKSPSLTPAAKGLMTVQGTSDWYAVRLDRPVAVKAGEYVWISQYDAANVRPAAVSRGAFAQVATYWRRPPGRGKWNRGRNLLLHPAWRILCASDTALYHTGTPKIGGSMSLDFRMPGSGTAFVLVGVKNPDLAIPGFCARALTSAEVPVVAPVINGAGSWRLMVPARPDFDGRVVFCQTWRIAAGRLVGTNGAALFFGR